jgi:isocitrate dehydrogenase (NAD+)
LPSLTTRTTAGCTQGIGPEISRSVKEIYDAAKVPIKWEEVSVTPSLVDGVSTIPADAIASIKKNTIALKGPLATPSESAPSFWDDVPARRAR